jgi:hypothetical protein
MTTLSNCPTTAAATAIAALPELLLTDTAAAAAQVLVTVLRWYLYSPYRNDSH